VSARGMAPGWPRLLLRLLLHLRSFIPIVGLVFVHVAICFSVLPPASTFAAAAATATATATSRLHLLSPDAASLQEPEIILLSPANGDVLDSATLLVHVQLRHFLLPLLGRRVCVGLASRVPEWRHEACLDDLPANGRMVVPDLVLGADYTLRVLLEDSGHVLATALRFFSVGRVPLPPLPAAVERQLRARGRLGMAAVDVPGAAGGEARVLTIEDALLLGTQLLCGMLEDVGKPVGETPRVWLVPSAKPGGPAAAAAADRDPWQRADVPNAAAGTGGGATSMATAAAPASSPLLASAPPTTCGSSAFQVPARAVFEAVQRAKPSHADAAHGVALTHMYVVVVVVVVSLSVCLSLSVSLSVSSLGVSLCLSLSLSVGCRSTTDRRVLRVSSLVYERSHVHADGGLSIAITHEHPVWM
jgi:hypothetical protein